MTPTAASPIEPMPVAEAVSYLYGSLPADPADHVDDKRTRALLGLAPLVKRSPGGQLPSEP